MKNSQDITWMIDTRSLPVMQMYVYIKWEKCLYLYYLRQFCCSSDPSSQSKSPSQTHCFGIHLVSFIHWNSFSLQVTAVLLPETRTILLWYILSTVATMHFMFIKYREQDIRAQCSCRRHLHPISSLWSPQSSSPSQKNFLCTHRPLLHRLSISWWQDSFVFSANIHLVKHTFILHVNFY